MKKRDLDRGQMWGDMLHAPMGYYDRPLPPTSDKRSWCSNQEFVKTHVSDGRVRCPDCSRLLFLREVHCVGGELIGFKFPPHKTKVKTRKMPSKSKKDMGRKGRK